jgi:hypothetical protein
MASTIKWFYDNGGSDNSPGTSNDLSAGGTIIRWHTSDAGTTMDTSNPIPVPSSGTNFSYWQQWYMEMTVRPGAEVVNNLKFYTDGAGYGTGITLYVGDENPVHTAAATTGYDLATGTAGTSGDEMITVAAKHTDLTTETSAFSYTSAAPRSMTIGEASSQMDAVAETGNYIVMQLAVGTTATPATLTAETMTGRYDEV